MFLKKCPFLCFLFLLVLISTTISCDSCGSKPPCYSVNTEQSTNLAQIDSINFFIDNSGSMRGLLFQPTIFKNQVYDFLSKLEYSDFYENRVLYFLASNSIDSLSKKEIRNIVKNKRGTEGKITGDGTPLQQIFENIFEKTRDDNQISIFITDGIFSGLADDIKQYKEMTHQNFNKDVLGRFEADISALMNTRKDLKILVYNFESDFIATKKTPYYNFRNEDVLPSNNQEKEKLENFPYYAFIIGKHEAVDKFNTDFYPNIKGSFTSMDILRFNPKPSSEKGIPATQYRFKKNVKFHKENLYLKKTLDNDNHYEFAIFCNGSDNDEIKSDNIKLSILLNDIEINNFDYDIISTADFPIRENNKTIYPEDSKAQKMLSCFEYFVILKINSKNISFKPDLNQIKLKWYKSHETFDNFNCENDEDGPEPHKTYGIESLFDGLEKGPTIPNSNNKDVHIVNLEVKFK